MPVELELSLRSARLKPVAEAAKRAGVRVVCLDTMLASSKELGQANASIAGRQAAFNAFALRIVENDASRRAEGKYIGLVGAAHLKQAFGVPGIAMVLKDCKSLCIFDCKDEGGENYYISSCDKAHVSSDDPLADVYIGARNPKLMSITGERSLEIPGFHEQIDSNLFPLYVPLDWQNKEGETMAFLAVKTKSDRALKALVEKRADINLGNLSGMTPLMLAVILKSKEMVEYLVKNGADIHAQDKDGLTPLHHAVKSNSPLIQALIEFGANPFAEDLCGRLPGDLEDSDASAPDAQEPDSSPGMQQEYSALDALDGLRRADSAPF